jgi:hypothetical protein
MTADSPIEAGARLSLIRGSNAIAKYLRVSVRTVARLRDSGAPIRKLNGHTSPLVADRTELRIWWEART